MAYDALKIEKKWRQKWEKEAFCQPLPSTDRKKFYGLVEFPYPSGQGLHIGHAFTFTVMDVLVRQKRMAGWDVLYPMGWDAFGLPTENYAIKTGIHPALVTKRNTNLFRQQMKRLGFSYNWEREINTSDPAYYHWTQWIFIQLFKHGLAYKKKMPINWCPSCKIGLANEEVISGHCERCGAAVERRDLDQWLLRITAYADRLAKELDLVDFPEAVKLAQRNWIGRSEGCLVRFPLWRGSRSGNAAKLALSAALAKRSPLKTIDVFTTRPDTLFGATFMVLAPEHPIVAELLLGGGSKSVMEREGAARKEAVKKYVETAKKKSDLERTEMAREKSGVFTGLYALNPVNGEKIPVWISDFVLASYGTGAIMAVPAHDERDWQFAKKYGLEIREVIKGGDVQKEAYTAEGRLVNSGQYNGLNSKEAIKKITADLEKRGVAKKSVQYHLRDWIFSRQHYWGEPIPMVYCSKCAQKGISWWDTPAAKEERLGVNSFTSKVFVGADLAGWFPVAEDELPLELPEIENYQPTGTAESPLALAKDWLEARCPVCGGPARRETDTMPNWAGSSWYYLAYCFADKLGQPPKNISTSNTSKVKSADTSKVFSGAEPNIFKKYRKSLDYWLPVDIYLGGAEHTTLHLLYSRFWHKFLNDIGAVPGKEPYQARRQHGVILAEDGRRMSKSRGNVINPDEMVKKLGADTLRLYLMFMGPYDQTMPWNSKGAEGCCRFLNRVWQIYQQRQFHASKVKANELKRKLHRLVKKVTADIQSLKHNTAIAAMMEFLNDWMQKGNLSRKEAGVFLRLLAPFAPFIAEELWIGVLGHKKSIHQQPWPKYDPKLIKMEMVTVVVQINGKLKERLIVDRPLAAVKLEIEKLAKKSPRIQKRLDGKKIKKVIFVPGRLINFVVK